MTAPVSSPPILPLVDIRGLRKRYGSNEVLKGVDLQIQRGEVVSIIGKSGSGKSTLLRCINALETVTDGQIIVNGFEVTSPKVNLNKLREHLGMVFQRFNLWPHKTVLENVMLAPQIVLGQSKEATRARALELLETVGLADKADAYPAQLSGGQKQRIAIARALATNPKVLLCDEATSALDPNTTHSILTLIKDINQKLGITVVVITHQMSVVKEICTHVAILDDGEVVEDGLVSAVFSAPKSQAARHLVFPGGADAAVSDPSQERRIRLIFRSAQTTAIPMVARLAAEESIYANVISASTQKLSEEVYGSMLLGIPNSQFDRAWQFFRTIPNLQAEEVSVDVQ